MTSNNVACDRKRPHDAACATPLSISRKPGHRTPPPGPGKTVGGPLIQPAAGSAQTVSRISSSVYSWCYPSGKALVPAGVGHRAGRARRAAKDPQLTRRRPRAGGAARQPVIAWFVAAFAPAPGTAITPRTASPVAAKLAATVRSLRMVSPLLLQLPCGSLNACFIGHRAMTK